MNVACGNHIEEGEFILLALISVDSRDLFEPGVAIASLHKLRGDDTLLALVERKDGDQLLGKPLCNKLPQVVHDRICVGVILQRGATFFQKCSAVNDIDYD